MNKTRRAAVVLATTIALVTTGCATTAPSQYRPVVDTKDVDLAQFERDLADCQAFARQTGSPGEGAAAGAAFGAVVMGLAAAALCGNSRDIGQWAAAGAVAGGAQGAAAGAMTQIDIIRNCMAGRGYRVLALRITDKRKMSST